MSAIDFILNIAGLLLWLNWRAIPFVPAVRPGMSLVSTIRPAARPTPRIYYLVALIALLGIRAVAYWQLGTQTDWSPRIPLGPVTFWFRSDLPGRMVLFSFLSFGVALGILYLCLLLLSWVHPPTSEIDPAQRLVRAHLGWLDRWPTVMKVLLPLLVTALVWCACYPLLVKLRIVPTDVNSPWRVVAQGAVVGLAVYLVLKFFLVAVFALYLLNSYVYLGEFPLWNFINLTARGLLRPIKWIPLQVGKIDFAPVLAIILVLVSARFSQQALLQLFQKLA
ncbi:MAG TPA: hypothetical protein VGN61_16630 [Verrucomicrobiae bacterium]|jgi:uncharacterized protein YggT (Ycf19 family)